MHNSNALQDNLAESVSSITRDCDDLSDELIQDSTANSLEQLFKATLECEAMQYTKELLDFIDVEIAKSTVDMPLSNT